MRRLLLLTLAVLLLTPALVCAQATIVTNTAVGDAVAVRCVNTAGGAFEGCGGAGTTDTDDASIATGQTGSLSMSLMMAFDATVWRRLTFGTAGSASTQVFTVQGIASATPVIVGDGAGALNIICDSGCGGAASFADNAAFTVGTTAVNIFAGLFDDVTPSAATENSAAAVRMSANRNLYGTIRDAAGNERGVNVTAGNALVVDASATTQPVSATNLDVQIGGSDTVTVTATNLDVQIGGSDSLIIGTFPDNEPINQAQVGGTAVIAERCRREIVTWVSISQTANAQLATGTASERIYICSFHAVTATAQNLALVSGTGTTCATSTSGVTGFGGATAATGWNFAANGGIVLPGAANPYGQTDTDADNLCLFQSGTGQVSGGVTYVSQ